MRVLVKHKANNSILREIMSHLTPESVRDMKLALDLAIRLKLGQDDTANNDKLALGIKDGHPKPVYPSPLCTAMEIAEYLQCLLEYGDCPGAKGCWITRRGFGKCYHKQKTNRTK